MHPTLSHPPACRHVFTWPFLFLSCGRHDNTNGGRLPWKASFLSFFQVADGLSCLLGLRRPEVGIQYWANVFLSLALSLTLSSSSLRYWSSIFWDLDLVGVYSAHSLGRNSFISDLTLHIRHLHLSLRLKLILRFLFCFPVGHDNDFIFLEFLT